MGLVLPDIRLIHPGLLPAPLERDLQYFYLIDGNCAPRSLTCRHHAASVTGLDEGVFNTEKSADFSTDNARIVTSHHADLDVGSASDMTALVRFRRASTPTQVEYIKSKNYGGAGVKWWSITIQTSGQMVWYWDNGTTNVTKTKTGNHADGEWHNAISRVARSESNILTGYWDGAQAVSATNDQDLTNTGDIYLGCRADLSSSRDFNGQISVSAYWDRALAEDEIWLLEHFLMRIKHGGLIQ